MPANGPRSCLPIHAGFVSALSSLLVAWALSTFQRRQCRDQESGARQSTSVSSLPSPPLSPPQIGEEQYSFLSPSTAFLLDKMSDTQETPSNPALSAPALQRGVQLLADTTAGASYLSADCLQARAPPSCDDLAALASQLSQQEIHPAPTPVEPGVVFPVSSLTPPSPTLWPSAPLPHSQPASDPPMAASGKGVLFNQPADAKMLARVRTTPYRSSLTQKRVKVSDKRLHFRVGT